MGVPRLRQARGFNSYNDLLTRYEKRVKRTELSAPGQLLEAVEALASRILGTARRQLNQQAVLRPLKKLSSLTVILPRIQEEKDLLESFLASKSLPLYYLLQLADSRATWLRSSMDWRKELNRLTEKCTHPLEAAEQILREHGGKSRLLLMPPIKNNFSELEWGSKRGASSCKLAARQRRGLHESE